ncbi:hypothetical protein FRC09_002271 [Ceratobasidium sp. 395]|nr:hypothetical protein FRC09_002271 [Ceratobasidium sp. 395]
MSTCFNDIGLIQQLQSLESRLLTAIRAGVDAYAAFSTDLESTLAHAQNLVNTGHASPQLTQILSTIAHPLARICATFEYLGQERMKAVVRQEGALQAVLSTINRRRRKRSTRSRKSKAGKNGRVRQSGKKSKRGRRSPVGNPKRRVQLEVEANTSKARPTVLDASGKKCRTVTAPPTDSMKFGQFIPSRLPAFMYSELTSSHNSLGPCRDFFLSHLGDPYPTTVQKHQILKQSSSDFTLRSLNLWFVNIRRRSKWMDIFKKHAASKRDAMRDLVARVEAQVAGRPAPNPLPSGAAPPGFKVEQEIVDEIMAMRAVVDMVSREVYGEGWDQILQIKPWTEEEVRAHEERKKMARREARAAKADGEKRKKNKEEIREQRRQSKETRKQVEQVAVEGILAARELHAQLMSANKRKRDDEGAEGDGNPTKKSKKGKAVEVDENGQPKKKKMRVPKVDEHGNPLTKEQRKALKKTMLAAQAQAQAPANPLKRKSPELDAAHPDASENGHPMDISPKRRRRDAVTFDGFPGSQDAVEEAGMPDLTQLFSLEWASPSATPAPLPTVDITPPGSNIDQHEFTHSVNDQITAPIQAGPVGAGEVPRRFSQQLATYVLESGMFDTESFGLFSSENTFPGMAVDVNTDGGMNSLMPPPTEHANQSMSVSPVQTESRTPMQGFVAPIQTHGYDSFAAPADTRSHSPPTPYSVASTVTPTGGHHVNADTDSDMSWINAAIAQLPSEHDVQQQQMGGQYHSHHHQASGSQDSMHSQNGYGGQGYVPESNLYGTPAFPPTPEQRAPVSHQRTQVPFPSPHPQPQHTMPPPPPPSTSPNQSRPSFPRPQSRSSVPPPSFPAPAPPQQRQRAPGSLWQTPYSQPAQQQQQQQHYQPAFSPHPTPRAPHSFPAPVHSTPQPSYNEPSYDHRTYSQPDQPPRREHEQPSPVYPQHQHQHNYTPEPAPAPSPVASASALLKQRELEFARAQEELQNRFKREQEEQLARFMQAQEDLRKQLLNEDGRS